MGTSVSSCQQKAESGISSHQNGYRIALWAMTNCFSAAPSRVAMVAAASLSGSGDALLRTLENVATLDVASFPRFTRCVSAAGSVSFSSSLALKRVRSRTVKLSSEQPKSTWKICTVPLQIVAMPPVVNCLETVPCTLMQVGNQQNQIFGLILNYAEGGPFGTKSWLTA